MKPIYTLEYIKAEAADIAAEWDGTDAGIKEERYHAACELLDKLAEAQSLIDELGI